MIAIVDYGMGNLRSVQKALQHVGYDDVRIVARAEDVTAADKLILPGVGAFKDAMTHLAERELIDPVIEFARSGRPFLGICLGMQLLFDRSEEDGDHAGLGLIAGSVRLFRPENPDLKVPHMGWNALAVRQPDNPLLAGLPDGAQTYFVHGYYCDPADASVIATTTDYGGYFCSSLHRDNIYAAQFHPEKSQRIGLKMLANFAAL